MKGKDLEDQAIYLDECIDHPFALGVFQEEGKWIAYYQDGSCREEDVKFDTEEAFDQLMDFLKQERHNSESSL